MSPNRLRTVLCAGVVCLGFVPAAPWLRAAEPEASLAPGIRGLRGPKRVYVGEFGAPVNDFAPERVQKAVQGTVETALDWGCPWVVYWQVYCNEARKRPVKTNDDVRGFCLVLPDGSKTWAWGYLEGILAGRAQVRKDTP